MNKKIIQIIISLVFVSTLCLSHPVFAQTETPEPTTNEQTDPATTEALKDRIEKAVEDKKINNNDSLEVGKTKRGFVGYVERVSEEAITFNTNKGTQIVPLNNQVQLIKGNSSLKVTDIVIEDSAIIMGFQEKDSFTPVKIIFSEKDLKPKAKLVLIGSLEEVKSNQLTIVSRSESQAKTISVTTQTKYEDLAEEPITKDQLFTDIQLLVAGFTKVNEVGQAETKTALIVRALAELK